MRSVLDIGIGQNPYFYRHETPCGATEYVALDKCAHCLDIARRRADEHAFKYKVPNNRKFMVGNASGLPFASESFDEIILSNVLSAPIHKDWDSKLPEYKTGGFGEKDPFYQERLRVLEETLRVLRPQGRILVYTDLIIYGQHSYELVLDHLRHAAHLEFKTLKDEQMRIDALNIRRISEANRSYSFLAEVLPRSSVFEIMKIR